MAAVAAARLGQRAGPAIRNQYRLAIAIGLFAVLLVSGGASRSDEPLQLAARFAAIVALVATLWPLKLPRLPSAGRWLAGVAALYALILLQLVPLPPDLWASLPGHGLYARIAEQSRVVAWRPLSLTPDLTLNALFALLPATALGLASLYLDSRARSRLWLVIVAGAVASAAIGMLQMASGGNGLRLYGETSADSAVGIFANRNHQMAFLACALPLLGALAAGAYSRGSATALRIAVAAGSALLLLVGIVLTGSRSGLVLAPVGLAGAWMALRSAGVRLLPADGWKRTAIAGGAAAILLALAAVGGRSGVLERVSHTDLASESRTQMLPPMIETAKAFMPTGAGFGSFNAVYRRFEPDSLLSTIYMNQAHNEPLQLAIEGGIPALALLALFLFWWGRTSAAIAAARPTADRRPIAIAALTVTVILMAESLVDYPLRTPLLGGLFVLACLEMARSAAPRVRSRAAAAAKQRN